MSLEQILAEYFRNPAYGVKAPTGTPTTNYTHGPGGLFGIAGLDEQVISTHIYPRGIGSALTVNGTIYTDPMYPYITGFEETGTRVEADGACDTCISGETESCIQTAPLGLICRESKELDIRRVSKRINQGEIDLQLVNAILNRTNDPFTPSNVTGADILNIQTAWSMYEVGVLFQNALIPMVWQGNPTNNSAGGGYKEFMGLDLLIGTNKVDALTGIGCEGLNSDVKDFNYNLIGSTDANGTFTIVDYINYVTLYLQHNAQRQGLMPVKWAIVMRPEAWAELLKVWPVAYFSTRDVVLPNGNTSFIDATEVRKMRDAMRDGMFLDTDAGRYPVITDDGIFEHTNVNNGNVPAGHFASSIYVVPISYQGNKPGTYIEYFDYRSAGREISNLPMSSYYSVSDSGRFIWTQETVKWCLTISGSLEPRIVLKVPQLAGKIENVLYSPTQHFRSFDQDSDYFYKGGVNSRTSPSLWSDWNDPR